MRIATISALMFTLWVSAALAAEQTWQPIGPDGGNVRSLAIDPKDPDRIFLGTSAGNLYLSTDRGANMVALCPARELSGNGSGPHRY